MKKFLFVIYAWGTTIAFSLLIIWLATIPNLGKLDTNTDELIKVLYRITLYALMYILFYRSAIATLKTTVDRLSKWRSRKEKQEDAEFVLIIETLVVIISILAISILAIFEEFIQTETQGRSAEIKDVLISIMSIILTSIVVYSMPVIGELEVAVSHKIKEGFRIK